jgi:methyltransferase (TIGR00027 family)
MKENSASTTAYTVLHGILHTAQNPRLAFLVDDEVVTACETLLAASPEGRQRLAQLRSPVKRHILPLMEWLLLPGITLNYVLRKKYIEDQVRDAIDGGVTQIVNIGAGFDTLAWRLSRRMPSVNFIEIDHPATSTEKQSALSADTVPNLHLLAADLSRERLESALGSYDGFDPARKTLYISEGVLMYLSEADVVAVFDSLRSLSGSGCRFIFSCSEPDGSNGHRTRPLLHLYLKRKNERYNWHLASADLDTFLEAGNYTRIAMAGSDYYRNNYLGPTYQKALYKGEYVVVAEAG